MGHETKDKANCSAARIAARTGRRVAAALICVLSAVQMPADSQTRLPYIHGIISVRK